nr:unnamed protein product [Spirometra erinaceieuropaei]
MSSSAGPSDIGSWVPIMDASLIRVRTGLQTRRGAFTMMPVASSDQEGTPGTLDFVSVWMVFVMYTWRAF